MKNFLPILLVAILVTGAFWYIQNNSEEQVQDTNPATTPIPAPTDNDTDTATHTYKDLLKLHNFSSEGITSPLTIEGEARGMWYFEASFPVVLTNWDGLIIAEGFTQAEGEWMTEEYVPFKTTLTFESPYNEGDPEFMNYGSLILQKDNPSGLPEHDDAFELPVTFAPQN